jgi:hypothetical protein
VRALKLAGEELQPDIGGARLLGERRKLDAPAEPLVLVHDDRDRDPGRADLPGEGDGPVELGPGDRAGRDLLGEEQDARTGQNAPDDRTVSQVNACETAPQRVGPRDREAAIGGSSGM